MLLGIGLVVSPYRLSANMAVADEVDVALKGGQARDVQVGEHRFHVEPIVVRVQLTKSPREASYFMS
jgi:hypothetical protein